MDQDYYISDDELARRLGIERTSVIKMIKKYKIDLEKFGEIKTTNTKDGKQIIKNYLLTNSKQYYLLVFYAKNTKKSVELKAQVVQEMFEVKKSLLEGTNK